MNRAVTICLETSQLILVEYIVAQLEEKHHPSHHGILLVPREQFLDWAVRLHWIIQQGIWNLSGRSLGIDLLPELGIRIW